MKTSLFYLLPCYNEEKNIPQLIEKFNNFIYNKNYIIFLVFVDDGSTDNSYQVISKLKKKKKKIKIKIIKHKKNKGLGAALKTGISYILKKGKENDVMITMDTDNSHTIEISMDMVKKIIINNKDIVIASRYCKKSKIRGLSVFRKFLSYIAAILFKLFYPIEDVRDYTSGFRAFKIKTIKYVVNKYKKKFFTETGFSITADILIKTYKHKDHIKYAEVPINLRYDLKKGDSKMKVFRTIYLSLRILFLRKLC